MSGRLHPELREFAPAPADPWGEHTSGGSSSEGGVSYGSLSYGALNRRLGDHIVRSEGFAGHASAYSLFEEMEDKDAHLFSALQTRKLGVLARRSKIEPAGPGERDRRVADWVEGALRRLPGWNAALLHQLDALGKGLAVAEVLWGFDAEGGIVPVSIRPRAAGRFGWSRPGGWRLFDECDPAAPGLPLPARKFLVCLFGATDERPYGKGLCEKVYWYWWFKKHNVTESCVNQAYQCGLSSI